MAKQQKRDNGLGNPAHLAPHDPGDQNAIQVIIETPKGSRNKYSFDSQQKVFQLKKVLPAGMAFPCDFGFVPSTVSEDGDSVDVLVLMDEPAFPGCLLQCRVIGHRGGARKEKRARTQREFSRKAHRLPQAGRARFRMQERVLFGSSQVPCRADAHRGLTVSKLEVAGPPRISVRHQAYSAFLGGRRPGSKAAGSSIEEREPQHQYNGGNGFMADAARMVYGSVRAIQSTGIGTRVVRLPRLHSMKAP